MFAANKQLTKTLPFPGSYFKVIATIEARTHLENNLTDNNVIWQRCEKIKIPLPY